MQPGFQNLRNIVYVASGMDSKEYMYRFCRLCMFPNISCSNLLNLVYAIYVWPCNAYRKDSRPPWMRSRVQTANTYLKGLGVSNLKTKPSLLQLYVQHECTYKLQDNSNELFKQVELESISKDSSDTAIWVARLVWPVRLLPDLAHPMKMLWKWLPRRGEAQ